MSRPRRVLSILMLAASFISSGRPTALLAQLDPCKLLTKAQVATVLPNTDGGSVTHSGPSLIEGVTAYQCSYVDPAFNLFTVVLNVAADDKRFAQIKPSFTMTETTKVAVADGGWLRGDPDDMKLTAVKGRTVIDLELSIPDAGQRGAALVTLGNAIAGQL